MKITLAYLPEEEPEADADLAMLLPDFTRRKGAEKHRSPAVPAYLYFREV